MNSETVTGLVAFVGLVLSTVGNYWLSKRTKRKGTNEAKTYTDEVVKLLQDDIASMQISMAEMRAEIYAKDEMIATKQAELDAARAENKALAQQLEEEHEALIRSDNRAIDLEKRVQVLEQQAAKNDAVKEAAAEIVKLIRDGFTQLVGELTPKQAPVVAVVPIGTEGNPT